MRFHHELTYDAPPADVHAMLADPEFREEVCDAQHGQDYTVSVDRTGEAMSVVVEQKRPSDDLPGYARKLVGDLIHVRQSEDWSDHDGAALDVAISGKPGRLTGTISLEGDDSGTVETVDGDLKVSIPVFGGKLEKLISDLLDAALDAEEEVGRAWLARGR